MRHAGGARVFDAVRWGWNAARALGGKTPPLPLPAVRATTILPFKAQPILAKAAD
jgi:hypothetical protein